MTINMLRYILFGKGRRKLTPEEKRSFDSRVYTYAHLRCALSRRVLGYPFLENLSVIYQLPLALLRSSYLLLLAHPEDKLALYKQALTVALKDRRYLLPVDRNLLFQVANKAVKVLRKKQKSTAFLNKYDILTPQDVRQELLEQAYRALLCLWGRRAGKSAYLTYAVSAARNHLVNMLMAYTAQKRQRIRRSSSQDRVYEATVISCEDFSTLPVDLSYMPTERLDPILLKKVKQELLKQPVVPWAKLKFIQALENGCSISDAVAVSKISQPSLLSVFRLASRLSNGQPIKPGRRLCAVVRSVIPPSY